MFVNIFEGNKYEEKKGKEWVKGFKVYYNSFVNLEKNNYLYVFSC